MTLRMAFTLVLVMSAAGCASNSSEPFGKQWEPDKRADVRTDLAVSYMQRNQLEVAREELEQALEIQPDHSRANHAMAALQDRLGNDDLAEEHYRRAVRSDPENSTAAHDYGTFLCRRDRVSEALRQFEKALANALYRQPEITQLRAGECLIRAGDVSSAEEYFGQALRLNPRLPLALYHMASINFERHNYLSARAYIERYFSLAPDNPRSLLLAVKIEDSLQSPDVADAYAARLRNKFASSKEAQELDQLKRMRK